MGRHSHPSEGPFSEELYEIARARRAFATQEIIIGGFDGAIGLGLGYAAVNSLVNPNIIATSGIRALGAVAATFTVLAAVHLRDAYRADMRANTDEAEARKLYIRPSTD
ncbi:MAG: hypothetical protein JWL85_385 [Candidatus Saccharibacteria bacterium]|nr:hypothetical protein [Candidatus Saccharibacteria bacterium]